MFSNSEMIKEIEKNMVQVGDIIIDISNHIEIKRNNYK
jgi:hypothetical protein